MASRDLVRQGDPSTVVMMSSPWFRFTKTAMSAVGACFLPGRLVVLAAAGIVAASTMVGMARADDDDDYLDCVLDKAQAIMKTQTRKDAAAALKKAYRVCQPLERPKEANIDNEIPLPGAGIAVTVQHSLTV
ncbi:hypothetical protein ACWGTI_14660 [Mesorhizobium sp. ArgA1]